MRARLAEMLAGAALIVATAAVVWLSTRRAETPNFDDRVRAGEVRVSPYYRLHPGAAEAHARARAEGRRLEALEAAFLAGRMAAWLGH